LVVPATLFALRIGFAKMSHILARGCGKQCAKSAHACGEGTRVRPR